jgi:hypothetical protein
MAIKLKYRIVHLGGTTIEITKICEASRERGGLIGPDGNLS